MLNISKAQVCFFLGQALIILFFGIFTNFGKGTSPLTPASEEPEIALYNRDIYPAF
jgi:ammonium transporter Rh